MNLLQLGRDILNIFRPPSDETVSEWADHYRVIVGKGASEPGPWHTDRAPYQKEIMDSYTQRGVRDIVVMSSAQMGKTDMIMNMMGRMMHLNPGPTLLVMPDEDAIEKFSKERLTPTIEETPVLNSLNFGGKGSTILYKEFNGGFISMTGAQSPSGLKSRPVANLFMDEVDGYPPSAGVEGDPVSLARKRTQNFAFAKRVFTSTPTLKATSRIYREFLRGTQEEWEPTCKHCGQHSKVVFDDICFDKQEAGETNGVKEYEVLSARWQCPKCKGFMDEWEVKRAHAEWVAYNPKALKRGIRSFHLNAFLSPWSDWKDECKKFLDAKDDPEMLKTFYNLELGIPFEFKDSTAIPEMLYMRREHYRAEVPNGVLVITIGIDTQGNRLEYEVKGWGRNEESWGLEYGVLPGRADEPEVWEMVDDLLDRQWHLENGRTMKAAVAFMDAGGSYWDDVVEQCYRRRHKHLYSIKGANKDTGPLVRHTKGTGQEQNRFELNVFVGKRAVLHNAGIMEPGPRYMHFPDDEEKGYDEHYFRGLISEQVKLVKKNGGYVEKWVKTYTRNEALDVNNYARCAFKGFKINLDACEQKLYGEQKIKKAELPGRPKKPKGLISSGIKV
jgi:phage terminase large subunit GpA-like protein